MSRYINNTDDEVFDFLSRQSAKPGEAIVVPDGDDECYVDHPVWKQVNSLSSTPAVTPTEPAAGSLAALIENKPAEEASAAGESA